jgi:hypothetical protein
MYWVTPVIFPEYTRLLKKFSHLDESDVKEFQKMVDQRFVHLGALTRLKEEGVSATP